MTFLSSHDLMCSEYVILCWHLQAQENGLFIWKRSSLFFQSVSLSLCLFLSATLAFLLRSDVRIECGWASERARGIVWLTDFRRRLCTQWVYMFSFRIPHLIHRFEFGSLFVCNPRCVSLVKQISTIPFQFIFVRSFVGCVSHYLFRKIVNFEAIESTTE